MPDLPAEPDPLPNQPAKDSSVPVTGRTRLGLRKRFEDFAASAPPAPATPPSGRGKRLGEILVAMGVLTAEQMELQAAHAKLAGLRLGHYLVNRKVLNSQQLCRALSLQSGLPMVELPNPKVPVAAKFGQQRALMLRFELVPFEEHGLVLNVAVKRPPSPARIPEMEQALARTLRFFLAPDDQIAAVLQALGAGQITQQRRHPRYRITMPIWLQLCDERNQTLSPRFGGRILDISAGGIKADGPEQLWVLLKDARQGEARVQVRFSTPPLEVSGICAVRYARKNDSARPGENACQFGLALKALGSQEQDNFLKLYERAKVATQRMEQEFGIVEGGA